MEVAPPEAAPPAPRPRDAARKQSKRERRAAAHAAAAATPAEVPAEAVPAPPVATAAHTVVEIRDAPLNTSAQEPPVSGRSSAASATPRLEHGGSDGGAAVHANACAAWPLPLRLLAVGAVQFCVWLTQLWAIVAGCLLVAPLRLLRAPARAVAAARTVAQRPLLVVSLAVAAPLYLREASFGIDFDALPPPRPATMAELGRVLKPHSASKWNERVRRARRAMEAAGVACAVVPAAAFSPGIEHRRVIWAHMCGHNDALPARLAWATTGVCALHSLAADCVEFREAASGRLMAFALLVTHGTYCAGALYASRPEVARAGIWVTNAAAAMELLLAGGPLSHVRVLDVGPTFAALKKNMGLHPLGFRATLRRAAWS